MFALGACLLLRRSIGTRRSRKTPSHTWSCFPITKRTRLRFGEPVKIFAARSGEKHKRIVLTMEGLEGPNSQDKAERFMAV